MKLAKNLENLGTESAFSVLAKSVCEKRIDLICKQFLVCTPPL